MQGLELGIVRQKLQNQKDYHGREVVLNQG